MFQEVSNRAAATKERRPVFDGFEGVSRVKAAALEQEGHCESSSRNPGIRRCRHTGPSGKIDDQWRREPIAEQPYTKLVAEGKRKLLLNLTDLTQVDRQPLNHL